MKWICAMAGAALLAGCQTSEEYAEAESRLEAEIAAKQGERVDRICFTRSVRGWRELGDDAVLLRRGVNDWYQVNLSGTCQPEWAFNAIAVRTRPAGSSCISRGDRIDTPDAPISGSCLITEIYEWNEDAEVPETQEY